MATVQKDTPDGKSGPPRLRADAPIFRATVQGDPPYSVCTNGMTPGREFRPNDLHRDPQLQSALRAFDMLCHGLQANRHRTVVHALEDLRRKGFEVTLLDPGAFFEEGQP
jgi:hypothetical protein